MVAVIYGGKRIDVPCAALSTVAQLKREIARCCGIPVAEQKLLAAGKQLDDEAVCPAGKTVMLMKKPAARTTVTLRDTRGRVVSGVEVAPSDSVESVLALAQKALQVDEEGCFALFYETTKTLLRSDLRLADYHLGNDATLWLVPKASSLEAAARAAASARQTAAPKMPSLAVPGTEATWASTDAPSAARLEVMVGGKPLVMNFATADGMPLPPSLAQLAAGGGPGALCELLKKAGAPPHVLEAVAGGADADAGAPPSPSPTPDLPPFVLAPSLPPAVLPPSVPPPIPPRAPPPSMPLVPPLPSAPAPLPSELPPPLRPSSPVSLPPVPAAPWPATPPKQTPTASPPPSALPASPAAVSGAAATELGVTSALTDQEQAQTSSDDGGTMLATLLGVGLPIAGCAFVAAAVALVAARRSQRAERRMRWQTVNSVFASSRAPSSDELQVSGTRVDEGSVLGRAAGVTLVADALMVPQALPATPAVVVGQQVGVAVELGNLDPARLQQPPSYGTGASSSDDGGKGFSPVKLACATACAKFRV